MKVCTVSVIAFLFLLCSCNLKQQYADEAPFEMDTIAKTVSITVNVGERMRKFAMRLERDSLTTVDAINRLATQEFDSIFSMLPYQPDSLTRFEGLFKPGNYQVAIEKIQPDDSVQHPDHALLNARAIIETLLAGSIFHFSDLDTSNGLTPYEKVILASIVEKEAVMNRGYDSITSVFYNRLKYGYPLASCITVEYVLGYHRPFLTSADIKVESPYNLYINRGLTPTPLCFVSGEALEAVQHPVETDLRYFVYDWTRHAIFYANTDSIHDINAEAARRNYYREFGRENVRKKYYGVFYEPVDNNEQ